MDVIGTRHRKALWWKLLICSFTFVSFYFILFLLNSQTGPRLTLQPVSGHSNRPNKFLKKTFRQQQHSKRKANINLVVTFQFLEWATKLTLNIYLQHRKLYIMICCRSWKSGYSGIQILAFLPFVQIWFILMKSIDRSVSASIGATFELSTQIGSN